MLDNVSGVAAGSASWNVDAVDASNSGRVRVVAELNAALLRVGTTPGLEASMSFLRSSKVLSF